MKRLFMCVASMLFAASFASCSLFDFDTAKKHEPVVAGSVNISISSPSGKIPAILETPALSEEQTCPIVILMHGFASSKNDAICAKVASSLREKGIASIRFDFNGHGNGYGRFQDMTIAKEIKDAKAVYDYAAKLDFVNKIGGLGHSQGALVCALIAPDKKYKFNAMVLMSAAFCIPDDARAGHNAGAEYDPKNVPAAGVPVEHGILGRDYIVEAQQIDVWKEIKGYDNPVYFVRGTSDPIINEDYVKRVFEIYPKVVYKAYDGDDHGFSHNFAAACNDAADFLVKNLSK